MSSGLYSGASGLALGRGLYRDVSGLWAGSSGLIAGFGGFSPLSLFAAGEPGAWYDPSDLTTMFQDSAGTTPVTATGQTVGLLLDKSKGLVLGPELVTNGGFSNGTTGWTLGAGWSVAGGVASFSNAAETQLAQSVSIPAGRTVEIIFNLNYSSGGGVYVFLSGGGGANNSPTVTGTGQKKLLVTASINRTTLSFSGLGGSVFSIDNISVRELPGNHATQSVLASRPLYQTVPDRLTLDKIDDRLLMTVPTGGFVGTMVLATPQGTAAYGVNIPAGSYAVGGTTTGAYFPGTAMQGYVIRNGALTQSQIDQTITYLRAEGGGLDYGAVTNFTDFWRNRSEITSFPLINTAAGTNFTAAWSGCSSLTSFPLIDTAAGTNFSLAWRGCSSLTSFPLIDTSAGTNFSGAWQNCTSLTSFPLINTAAATNFSTAWFGCSSLTSFPANFFNGCAATNFTNAFTSTALNQASIDGILVSINSNGTSNGTFNQSGGSARSATGQAAIDALRARGWTVTVTGGY